MEITHRVDTTEGSVTYQTDGDLYIRVEAIDNVVAAMRAFRGRRGRPIGK